MRILALLALSFLAGCTGLVEEAHDLGHGYMQITRTEKGASWERFGHFSYLYFRNRKLGSPEGYSIAPSGHYAIYHDIPSGCLFLFTARSGKTIQLTDLPVALGNVTWDESHGKVTVQLKDGKAPREYRLE